MPESSAPAPIPAPSAADLSRDVAKDYRIATTLSCGHDYECCHSWGDGFYPCDCGYDDAKAGWPAALRRLAAAEAEVERLTAENARLREASHATR